MRKINIGAGDRWQNNSWETLDNGTGNFQKKWQHVGNAWDTQLPGEVYDVVYTSHMLEHIPHFLIEQTISEFNRIMKPGGLLRIAVPDLKKAARAYLEQDMEFFTGDAIHDAGHLGFGGLFMNMVVSPGQQTYAVNRNFDAFIGSYGHVYAWDFDMFRILLEKWGFSDVVQCDYGDSQVEELKRVNAIVWQGKDYPVSDKQALAALKQDSQTYVTGFDNKPVISLYLEARKERSIPYSPQKEFPYNLRNKLTTSRVFNIKLALFKPINNFVNWLYSAFLKIKR